VNEPARIIDFPTHRRRPEPLLTLRDLRATFGFSERWWRYRIAEGLPTVRWGGTLMFRASEVEAWMEARPRRNAS
jgi:predicted DNA-binding transcriptional regulator AlpA